MKTRLLKRLRREAAWELIMCDDYNPLDDFVRAYMVRRVAEMRRKKNKRRKNTTTTK